MSWEASRPHELIYVSFLQLIRDEIKSGKSDKEIYKKLEEDFGETVLYAPKFDLQTAAIWLSPVSLNYDSFSMLSKCPCFYECIVCLGEPKHIPSSQTFASRCFS